MTSLLCLILVLVTFFLQADCKPQAPIHDWSTLPVFYHSANVSGPYTDEAVQFISNHYAMVTIEKFQGVCAHDDPKPSCKQEEVIITELARFKKVNPKISTILYLNSVFDFSQYSVHAEMLADPSQMFHNSSGDIYTVSCPSPKPCDCFDLAQERVRELFMSICTDATDTGVVDGCFLDQAINNLGSQLNNTADQQAFANGHNQMMSQLQQRLGQGVVIANHGFGYPHDNITGVSFAMHEFFTASNQSIQELLLTDSNNRGMQAHGSTGSLSEVAAFLIGAGQQAYFGYGDWDKADPAAHWNEDLFTKPVGKPLEQGLYDSETGVWSRKFEHIEVSFDTKNNIGQIHGW